MVSCTESRPGSVTTLRRAKAVVCRASAPRQMGRNARFMSVAPRFVVALDVQAVEREGDRFLRFLRQGQAVLDGERVLPVECIRGFHHPPVTGNMFDDDQLRRCFLEILNLDLVLRSEERT